MRPTITMINGSLGGSEGNTSHALAGLIRKLETQATVRPVHLASFSGATAELETLLRDSQGFVFATGTYWDSWGSPLQKFFEDATDFEASDLWLGKPAATFVTMHSVGGKEVLSRLQGVLSTLGLLIPPMSGMTYSLANHLSLKTPASDFHADLWQLADLEIIGHNLLEALSGTNRWKPWPIDSADPKRLWF